MAFNSIIFLFYFLPVFFLAYYIAGEEYKKPVALAGSLFFCAWGAPKFIFVVLAVSVINYLLVAGMSRASHKPLRVTCFVLSLLLAVSLFVLYKYMGVFAEDFFWKPQMDPAAAKGLTRILTPLGLSYFTFGTISYTIDVYRGACSNTRSVTDYIAYIVFFPKFIAGPVAPYHIFAPQITGLTGNDSIDNRLQGLFRLMLGLAKKVLIADTIATGVDAIFSLPVSTLNTQVAWMGAIGYAMQIYFDFSGYSDMAIGLSLMMGIRLPENFNSPYTALSVTGFWQRWHMSFVSWLKTYLFIPRAGKKPGNTLISYLSLCFVFLVFGMWHGRSAIFLIWAAWHGVFVVAEYFFLGALLRRTGKFAVVYSFIVVVIGWVIFRVPQPGQALLYVKQMFSWHTSLMRWPIADGQWYPDRQFIYTTAAALFFSFFALPGAGQRLSDRFYNGGYPVKLQYLAGIALLVLFILSAARISGTAVGDFIYAKF